MQKIWIEKLVPNSFRGGFAALAFWAFLASSASGQPGSVWRSNEKIARDGLEILETENAISPDSAAAATGWRLAEGNFQNFGFSKKTAWLRVVFDGQKAATAADSVLEIVCPYAPLIEVFQKGSDQKIWQKSAAGAALEFAARGNKSRNFRLVVRVEKGQRTVCLVRLQPMKMPMAARIFGWEKTYRATEQAYFENAAITAFFVLFGLYLVFLGAFSWISRLHYFWFYFAYAGLFAFFLLVDYGLAFQFGWPRVPYFQQVAAPALLAACAATGAIFLREHFSMRRLFPRIGRALDLLAIANFGCCAFAFLLPNMSLEWGQTLVGIILGLLVATSAIIFFLLFGFVFISKKRQAGLFLLGFAAHGAMTIGAVLQFLGFAPKITAIDRLWLRLWPVTSYSDILISAGMGVEMSIVLFVGVGRLRQIFEEKNRALRRLAEARAANRSELVMGIETERKRIAQELHDGTGVQLSAIKLRLNLLKEKRPEAAPDLDKIIALAEQTNRELRRLSHDLMPKTLSKFGLVPAIEELLAAVRAEGAGPKTAFFCNVSMEKAPAFVQISLFRIVQEAVNNALRHAEATEISVQITRQNGHAMLTIEDNGKGFEAEKTATDGLGLQNIRHRAEALGGKIWMDSTPGRGTLWSIEFEV